MPHAVDAERSASHDTSLSHLSGNQRRMCCPTTDCGHNSLRERKARHVGRACFGPYENNWLAARCQAFGAPAVESGAADRDPGGRTDAAPSRLMYIDESPVDQPVQINLRSNAARRLPE